MFTLYADNDLFSLPDPEQQEIYAYQTPTELQAFSSTGRHPKQIPPSSQSIALGFPAGLVLTQSLDLTWNAFTSLCPSLKLSMLFPLSPGCLL